MTEPKREETPKARTILIPFRRPLWQNLLVPVGGFAVLYGSYALTIVLLGNMDIVAAATSEGIDARYNARLVGVFLMCVYFALATGLAFGWPILNLVFPIFLPFMVPGSLYVLFQGPVPADLFTTGVYYGLGIGDAEWTSAIFWVGVVAAVGLLGTFLLFERLYLTTYEQKKAYLDRLPKF